jgi:ribosomal subunit interface protein
MQARSRNEDTELQKQVEISHHGFESSEALDEFIAQHVAKLEKFHHGIIGCRVAMDRASHRSESHDAWSVKVAVTVPPRQELVATKVVDKGNHNQKTIYQAVDGAFEAVAKQLRKLNKKHG